MTCRRGDGDGGSFLARAGRPTWPICGFTNQRATVASPATGLFLASSPAICLSPHVPVALLAGRIRLATLKQPSTEYSLHLLSHAFSPADSSDWTDFSRWTSAVYEETNDQGRSLTMLVLNTVPMSHFRKSVFQNPLHIIARADPSSGEVVV